MTKAELEAKLEVDLAAGKITVDEAVWEEW